MMLIDWYLRDKLYNVLYYFGVLPFPNNNYNIDSISTLRNCYLISLKIIFIFASLYQIPVHTKRTSVYLKTVGPILATAAIFVEMLMILSVTCSITFEPVKNWKRLFRFIHEDLKWYFEDKLLSTNESLIGLYLQLSSLTIVWFIITLNDIMSTIPIVDEMYFLGTRSSEIYVMLYVILFIDFVALFKRRFKCLNQTLEQLINRRGLEEDKLSREINGTIVMYRKICESVDDLNSIFGSFNLFLILYFILKYVYWISMAIHSSRVRPYFLHVVFGYSVYYPVSKT